MRTAPGKKRRRLGDDPGNPTYIFTEPRGSYRLARGQCAFADFLLLESRHQSSFQSGYATGGELFASKCRLHLYNTGCQKPDGGALGRHLREMKGSPVDCFGA